MVVSNTNSKGRDTSDNSWYQECASRNNFASTVKTFGQGDAATSDTKVSSKTSAFGSHPFDELMICEMQSTNYACRRYEFNQQYMSLQHAFDSISNHDSFQNKVKSTELSGTSWDRSSFVRYETLDFNMEIDDDGAQIASSWGESATAGISCRVNNGCSYSFTGQLCSPSGGSTVHYNYDAIDSTHTAWVYTRAEP